MGLDDGQNLVTQVWDHDVTDDERYRYRWASNLKVTDQRDTMHQRGWTTFKVHGRLGNKRVMGYGQLPFTASQARNTSPGWSWRWEPP